MPPPRVVSPIETAILAARDAGQQQVVIPPGTYECPGPVRLELMMGMTIIMAGVVMYRNKPTSRTIPKTQEYWSLASCFDLRIAGPFTVQGWKPFEGGYYPKWEGHHAFGIHACERVSIESVKIRDVWGDFFYLRSRGRKTNYHPNKDVTLLNIDADDCGRHTIGMHAIDGLNVVGGTFSNWHGANQGHGIDYEALVPEDYHANVHISPQTVWQHQTPTPRP